MLYRKQRAQQCNVRPPRFSLNGEKTRKDFGGLPSLSMKKPKSKKQKFTIKGYILFVYI